MKKQNGFALISVLMFMSVVVALAAAYAFVTRTETRSLHSSKDSFSGFNAAEAGLNLRADMIKNNFEDYNRPSGVSPANVAACDSPNTAGSGSFACQNFTLGSKHVATSYVVESPGNPQSIVIPKGEAFAGLTASEYRYTVTSIGKREGKTKEAYLELMFKTRLIPLFQFLLFFNDDLELVEGGRIVLDGPIHTNRDIYYAQQSANWIADPLSYFKGPISSAMKQFRGAKFQTSCNGGSGGWSGGWNYDILVHNLSQYVKLPPCTTNRFELTDAHLKPFNTNIVKNVTPLTVPNVKTFKAFALPDPAYPNTFTYWQRADVRFVLRLNAQGRPNTANGATGIEVVGADGSVKAAATARLNSSAQCPGAHVTGGGAGRAVGAKGPWKTVAPYTTDNRLRLFRDYQYDSVLDNYETLIDVDVRKLLDCMNTYRADFFTSGGIDDSSDGGLVLFFAIDGPLKDAASNNYAVRFSNAALLQSTILNAPKVKGLTLVTDQKGVLWGDYNANDATWIPSALLSDAQYVLSNAWTDAKSETAISWTNRFTGVTTLTQKIAILTGATPSCGGNGVTCEGSLNQWGGSYTGVFRYNETFYDGTSTANSKYIQQPMVWQGSIVSLGAPKHVTTLAGPFTYFSSPSYAYSFDTRFNDPNQLPPLTPRAVYNKQELFERDYQ
jgi:hypothetical protein